MNRKLKKGIGARQPHCLEAPRPRRRRTALAVAVCSHLDLVHPDTQDHDHLVPASVVHEEDHTELPRPLAALRHCLRAEPTLAMTSSDPLNSNIVEGMLDARPRGIGTGPSRDIEHLTKRPRRAEALQVHPLRALARRPDKVHWRTSALVARGLWRISWRARRLSSSWSPGHTRSRRSLGAVGAEHAAPRR